MRRHASMGQQRRLPAQQSECVRMRGKLCSFYLMGERACPPVMNLSPYGRRHRPSHPDPLVALALNTTPAAHAPRRRVRGRFK